METQKFLVLKGGAGSGLGDLIRSLISAIHYSIYSHRKLIVMWDGSLYSEKDENIFHDFFGLSQEIHTIAFEDLILNSQETLDIYPKSWQGNLHLSMKQVYRQLRNDDWDRKWAIENLSFDQSKFDYSHDVLVMWDFDGFLTSWKSLPLRYRFKRNFLETQTHIASNYITLNPQIHSHINQFKKTAFSSQMVGIHIRKTNEKGATDKYIGIEKYIKLMKQFKDYLPQVKFFLSTDNQEVQNFLTPKYGDLIVNTEKWFPEANQPIHIIKAKTKPQQVAREALMDMFLLSQCGFLIYPHNSSFSQISRIFSSLPRWKVYPLSENDRTLESLQILYKRSRLIFSTKILK